MPKANPGEARVARTIYNDPALPRSKSPHSNAVRIGGLIFVSGFPGYDDNVQVAKGDFAAQMRQALKHVKATLEYAGSSIEKIGKVNVYLDRRADFDELNEIYKEFFGTDPSQWPARTTVEARLPRKDFLVEVDCVAEA
jgi:reactive intermediate/imine deaminase